MRLYGILGADNDGENIITQIFTSLDNAPEDETIFYTDEEGANIYNFETWKVYSGDLEEIWDAIKVGDKYVDYDRINAEDLPEEYTYTETLTRVDWDKLMKCPRGVVYGVYKEGKKVDTKFVEG
jgi:hypothetical protein